MAAFYGQEPEAITAGNSHCNSRAPVSVNIFANPCQPRLEVTHFSEVTDCFFLIFPMSVSIFSIN